MLQEVLEPAWVDAFEAVLVRCALRAGDTVAVLSESQSRPVLVELARLAAARMGCKSFAIQVPTLFEGAGPPVRSTGACTALQQMAPVVSALAASTLVVDCTVEGLMHAPELPAILGGGARVIYVSNEHPEALARLQPNDRSSRWSRITSSGCARRAACGFHRPPAPSSTSRWTAPPAAATGATPRARAP